MVLVQTTKVPFSIFNLGELLSMAVKTPHFAAPFRFGLKGAVVNEQDSEQEIDDCVETILRYEIGHRPEKPDFGRPELIFEESPIDITKLQEAIDTWEPRNEMAVGRANLDKLDELITKIRVGGPH